MSLTWRRLLFLILVVALVIPAGIYAQEDLTETYLSADGLVEFRYPADWLVNEEELAPAILIGNSEAVANPDVEPEAGELVVLMIPVVTDYPYFPFILPGSTTMEAAEILIGDMLTDVDSDRTGITGPVEVQVGPYDAVRVDASMEDDLDVFILVMDADTYLMSVVALAGPGDLDAYVPTLLAIAETFVYRGEPLVSEIVRGEAGDIAYGQTFSANLENPAGDRWTFTGSAGDVVTIAMLSGFDNYLELYGPTGDQLTSDDDSGGSFNALISEFVLPANGTYAIVARGYSSGARGPYTLELTGRSSGVPVVVTQEPVIVTQPGMLAYGETVEAVLEQDDGDSWRFSGRAGDVVTIALNSDTFDTYLALYGPDGALLIADDDSGGSFNSLISEIVLPAAGEYVIVARGFSNTARGAYNLALSAGVSGPVGPADPTPGSLVYGEMRTANLAQDGGDRWTFTGSAGDLVVIALNSDAFDTYLELYGPNENLLITDDDSGGNLNSLIDRYVLPEDGTYTIVARGFSNTARGDYTISLGVTEPIAPVGTLSYGETREATLQTEGGDRWAFEGSAGDLVIIALDSEDFDTYLELYGPDGVVLTVDDDSGGSLNSLIDRYMLPVDGTYAILARGFSTSARGNYTLTLDRFDASALAQPGKITYDSVVEAMLSDSSGDRWTFAGNAGDVITVAFNSSSFDAFLEIYGPNEEFLTSDDDSGGSLNSLITGFTLPSTGQYTIVARSYGASGTGLYTLELARVDPSLLQSLGTLEIGTLIQGSLSMIGERWTYTGSEGERISVLVGGDDVYVDLLDAENELIATTQNDYSYYGYTLLQDVTLPVSGEYTLIIRTRYVNEYGSSVYFLMLGHPGFDSIADM